MRRRRKTKGAVSASVLARMGVCERLVVFEHREGRRPTPTQRVALRRGLRAHRQFAAECASNEQRIGRCFIATLVFGEGQETRLLRRFRERVLRPSRAGRRLILGYYRVAPSVCRAMQRWPMLRCVVRAALRPFVWFVMRRFDDAESRHVG